MGVIPLERLKIWSQTAKLSTFQALGPARQLPLFQGGLWHLGQLAVGSASRLCVLQYYQQMRIPSRQTEMADKWVKFLGASLGGLVLSYPLDVLFTRRAVGCQNSTRLYAGLPISLIQAPIFLTTSLTLLEIFKATRPIYEKDLPKSLFAEEGFCNRMKKLSETSLKTTPHSLILGFFCGFLSQSLVYPLDTLRRQYIVQRPSISSLTFVARQTFGWHLYSGYLAHCLKTIPEVVVLCGSFYAINSYLPH